MRRSSRFVMVAVVGAAFLGACSSSAPKVATTKIAKHWPVCCDAGLTKVANDGATLGSDLQSITNQDMSAVQGDLALLSADATTSEQKVALVALGLGAKDSALKDVGALDVTLKSLIADTARAAVDCTSLSDACQLDAKSISTDISAVAGEVVTVDRDAGVPAQP